MPGASATEGPDAPRESQEGDDDEPGMESAAFRRAIAVSAACETLRRAGLALRLLRRSAEKAVADGAAPSLDEEAAACWLRRRGCLAYLGGGSFGHVYRVLLRNPPPGVPSEVAVKWIASYPSESGISGNAAHEYTHHQLFADAALAWGPVGLVNATAAQQLSLSGAPARALQRNVAGILMPLVDTTLDKLLKQKGPGVMTDALGQQLVELLDAALRAGMAHNDAKANNVGLRGGDVRFIDFGRALSGSCLHHLKLEERRRVLEEATVADALRLAASLQHLARDPALPALLCLREYARALSAASEPLQRLVADQEERRVVQILGKRVQQALRKTTREE